ncbi:MAG: ATP-binding protein [Lachnospiraceae bacterium]|nr:ATP-binding protein [Lachnospiraceae bacterium]
MKEITLDATVENIGVITDFVDEFLDENDCSMDVKMQVDIAIDELFSNIAFYAYTDKIGKATVRVEIQDSPKAVCITFIDSGVPYNPLEKPDPDVTLSAEDRKIGGLGIFIVKRNMDAMQYNYCNGQNRLQITKYV